ncbi:sugar phosphate isomerase/epimerase family protein [Desulfosporosinus sp. OT]|uniref:sugar phosphate isomerase/epimerase family protein n=1 Tax=Desulfosporosinus sp. OT TaxID=913865 RepID=UPI000223B0AF|nr:sugar phosphate isomerase/epimerase family protein [Desulfosporosinus sp. OT]EGW38855.1 xylose isomerase-like TIM barrel family protein [Desulfosporosinus sp. OT]
MRHQYPLGIFSWFGFVLPFQERLRLIKEAGFTATSIWWEDEDTPWQIKKESMPQLVRDTGLVLENLHVPYNNSNELWSEHESVRFEFLQRHTRWLYDCANYHIPMMVMHLTEEVNHSAPNGYGLKSMLELVKVAEELGVIIAIENTRRSDNVPYLLSKIRSNYLGFCYDSSHHFLSDKQDFSLLVNFGDRLVTTHLSDNDGLADRHWLPGHGIIDWAMVAQRFPTGYRGVLTLEAYPMAEEREESPQVYLKRAYQKVKNVQDLLEREG